MFHLLYKFKTWQILTIIFLLALVVRVWGLGVYPQTFQEDEVLSGYVGRYLIANGMDIYGNRWPLLYFNKFDDFYIIGPMYLVGVAITMFGAHEWVVRLPVALAGAAAVFPLYYVAYWIFRRRLVATLSALLLSVMPWHLTLSRGMAEGVLGVTLFLLGVLFLLRSVERSTRKELLIGSFLLFLTYWVYHPFRLYAPVVFLPLFFLFPVKKYSGYFFQLLAAAGLFTCLTIYIVMTPWGSGRLKQTSIFSDLSGVQMRIQQSIYNTGEGRIIEARLFHNKAVGYSREYVRQYLSYFSPEFLFVRPVSESRYDVPEQGLLFFVFLIGIAVSIFTIWRQDEQYRKRLTYLFFLIVLAPVPAAFTYFGSPNVHRSALLAPLLAIIVAYGWQVLLSFRWKRVILVCFILVLGTEVIYFFHQYTTQADVYTSMRRNDGFPQLARYLQKHHADYETVYVPSEGNTALYYLFYSQDFSPVYAGQFSQDAHIERIDNIIFVKNSCASEVLSPQKSEKNILVINRHSCAEPKDLEKIAEINGVNLLLGFSVYKL